MLMAMMMVKEKMMTGAGEDRNGVWGGLDLCLGVGHRPARGSGGRRSIFQPRPAINRRKTTGLMERPEARSAGRSV
jgi:hypothetical protein